MSSYPTPPDSFPDPPSGSNATSPESYLPPSGGYSSSGSYPFLSRISNPSSGSYPPPSGSYPPPSGSYPLPPGTYQSPPASFSPLSGNNPPPPPASYPPLPRSNPPRSDSNPPPPALSTGTDKILPPRMGLVPMSRHRVRETVAREFFMHPGGLSLQQGELVIFCEMCACSDSCVFGKFRCVRYRMFSRYGFLNIVETVRNSTGTVPVLTYPNDETKHNYL